MGKKIGKWAVRLLVLGLMLLVLTGCAPDAGNDSSCGLCGRTTLNSYDLEKDHGVGKCVQNAPCGVEGHLVLEGKTMDKNGVEHTACTRCGQLLCQGEHGPGKCEETSGNTAAKSASALLESLRLLDAKGTEIPLQRISAYEIKGSPDRYYSVKRGVVLYAGDTVTVKAVTGHYGATVTGAGTYTLHTGANIFKIIVTAEDGKTRNTYELDITGIAKPSGDWSLHEFYMTLPDDTVIDLKNAEARQHITVRDVIAAKVTATPSHSKATVSGDVGDITIVGGENTYRVTVTAEDGTSEVFVYKITASFTPALVSATVRRSQDATLQSLTLTETGVDGGELALAPSFSPEVRDYMVECGGGKTVTLAALTNHAGAAVAITHTGAEAAGDAYTITGGDVLTVTVTAEDGFTTRVYTITAVN